MTYSEDYPGQEQRAEILEVPIDIFQNPFITSIGIKGNLFDKNSSNVLPLPYSTVRNLKPSSKNRNKADLSALKIAFQHCTWVIRPDNALIHQRNKERKGIQMEKEEIKLPLFLNDATIYVDNIKVTK